MGIFTKIFIWPFLCIPRVVLFITTYFGHSTTKNSLKYQIWNFAFWVDKMSQNRAIFFEIAHKLIKETPIRPWQRVLVNDMTEVN